MLQNLKTQMTVAATSLPRETLLTQLGYSPKDDKASARVQAVLDSPFYGLEASHFDFKYGGVAFVQALGQVLGIDSVAIDTEIERAQARLRAESDAFKPYLWVDTQFKRKTQPIFALAFCEPLRFLQFAKSTALRPLGEQLCEVRQRIQNHMQETGGTLVMWGPVHQYFYYYADGKALVFSREADLLGERLRSVPDKAIVTLQGKPLF